jgi:glucosylglycerate synthase
MDAVPQPELEWIERAGGADIVVGILDPEPDGQAGAATAMVREALAELSADLSRVARVVVLCNNGTHGPAATGPDRDNADGGGQSPAVFSFSLPAPGPAETPQPGMSEAYRSVFAMGGKLGVRACGVIASQLRAVTPQWIYRLVQPVLELGFDLVAPRYTRHKMEGLLNRSVLSPLHRALYGEQLQNPMGPDFGLSGKLLHRAFGQNSGVPRGTESHPVACIAPAAVSGGFRVCESHLGARTQPPTDWMNLSSLLARILGPVFLEMERQAAFWQRIRGSNPVPGFGFPEAASEDGGTADVHRMIESFQLGTQNLQDVWGLILPPMTLLELRKLSRLPPDQFRMPDDLWVRIVYDFALGHRLRTISRDHLLRSVTPLYLGWIASYTLEMESAGPADIEARTERLARAYEAGKPYLVSRWRWPDRFNP